MSMKLKDIAAISISGSANEANSALKATQDGSGNVITSTYSTKNELSTGLDTKVDKVTGKGLSTEDFTTALKNKLESLSNYNDTTLAQAVDSLQSQMNTLLNSDPTTAIESFNEIVAFLNGITDSETLDGIISGIEGQISAVQAKIPTNNNQLTNGAGYITSASLPSAAGSSLGTVKSGGDVTISSGVITVNDNSHSHTISNISDLSTASTTANGLMTKDMVTKLNGIATGATANTGTVTSVATGTGLTGGPITTTGTISLATSGATAGTYGPSAAVTGSEGTTMNVPSITVDTYGRVTAISNKVYTAKDTTYSAMTAATSSAAGKAGLVPAPGAGKNTSFLRGDGTWATPANDNTTYTFASGTNQFTVTPSGGTAQTISVTPSITSNVTYSGTLTSGQIATFDGTAGKIKASGFTIATSVPANAVFTDTTYSAATASSDGLMTSAMFTKLNGIATGATANTGTVTSVAAGTGLEGGTITTSGTISLAASGVTAGSAGPTAAVTGSNGTTVAIPRITVDTYGRVTALTSYNLTCQDSTGPTYTSGTGVTVGSDNKISLASGVVTAGSVGPTAAITGSHGTTVAIPRITVDTYGRVTARTSYNLTCQNTTYSAATTSANGLMSSTDKSRLDFMHSVNSRTTLASIPNTGSIVTATLSKATSISMASALTIGQSVTVICTPSASFTQPIPTSGSFISMDGDSISVTSGKKFEINILCYASGKYSISCKTAV